MSIQEHLNKIRNAIYGREVRESIAKGIETAYDDASENGNANMEVKIARGTHPNLRSRLEEVDNKQQQTTAQLAQKITKGEVSTLDIDKNLGKLDQTYMSDEFLQQMAGTTPVNATPASRGVTSGKLADKAVIPEKTNFLESKGNVFNKNGPKLENGYFSVGGTWNESTSFYTMLVRVKPNTTYETNAFKMYQLVFFDENMAQISGVSSGWTTINTPDDPNVCYAALVFRYDHGPNVLESIMVVEGTLPSVYIPYGFILDDIVDLSETHTTKIVDKLESRVNVPKISGMDLLVFGDSIAQTSSINEDGTGYNEYKTNWPSYTRTDLEASMVNYARDGATFKDQNVTGDVRKSMAGQIEMALNVNTPADIIVVSSGTNDGIGNIGDYNTAMSKTTLTDLDRTNLYEAIRWSFWKLRLNYPDAICFAGLPIQRTAYEPPEALLDAIKKMAKRYNFILIDGTYESGIVRDFEVSGGEGRYLVDGLHPNETGKRLLANLYTRVILNSLNY